MFSYIFNQHFMETYAGGNTPVTRAIGSLAGKGMKILNFTNYDIAVLAGTEQIDYIPAYQFLVMPNATDLSLQLANVASTNYSYPTPYVAVKTFDNQVNYELGSLIHFTAQAAGDTVNVAGNMQITGTPTMNIGNTPNVNISGTPTVELAAGASVGITGNPTVNIAANQSIGVTGTVNANITSGTVNAQIQNAQINSQVVNASNNPVPTTGNYYGSGADGDFLSSGNVTISNVTNGACILNYKSFNLQSGHTFQFANQAKYIIIYCQGDVTISGTLISANAVTNVSNPAAISINGKTLPNGGQGGSANGNAAAAGTAYAPSNGRGGAGGSGGAGGGTGTGYGNVPGGPGASDGQGSASPGTGAATIRGATLAIVAGGSITINGTINNSGVQGGNGGAGSGGSYQYGGGGGSCGNNQGGGGGAGSNSGYGGSGAGGSGGGVVFLYAGGSVSNNGTINTNGGAGGSPGTGPMGSGSTGGSGIAGPIAIYQMGGTLGA